MASCLSGAGGRTYGFDFDFIKSPPSATSTRTSPTSSPSSTISESSNSVRAIFTRKPRTPRKRPNQTYNEAATLLSTAYPNLFSTKDLKKPGKFTKPAESFSDESSELLLPFRDFEFESSASFLLHQPIQHKPSFPKEPKMLNMEEKPCQSPGEISSSRVMNSLELDDDCQQDFDAESILDEEIEEGIDSIMGSRAEDSIAVSCQVNPWFGFGEKLDLRLAGVRALRHRVDDGNCWNFPAVDIFEISPRINKSVAVSVPATEKKKKSSKIKPIANLRNPELPVENATPNSNLGLLLKLNYDEVRNAWSDRGSPFTDESPGSGVPGNDVNVCFSSRAGQSKSQKKKIKSLKLC